jgi:hypothetical protein
MCKAVEIGTSITISGVNNTSKIAIFSYRMCYGENGMVKFLETLADDVCRHNYSIIYFWLKGNILVLIHLKVLLLNNYEISSIYEYPVWR